MESFVSYVSPEQVQEARRYSLLRLLPADVRLKPKGQDRYVTNCLMHEDPTASLSLRKYPDGCWRYHCFGCGQSGDPIQFLQKTKGMTFMDAVSELSNAANQAPVRPIPVAEYEYKDETGHLLYTAIRYSPKQFRIKRPDPSGAGCIWNVNGVRRVLYRLPELIAAPENTSILFYVEGEKDVETLRSKGLTATTHAGGANSFREELLDQIPERFMVVCIPDLDDPGKQLMRRVWAGCQARKRQVGFILLPFTPQQIEAGKKDVTDWFELWPGAGTEQLLELIK